MRQDFFTFLTILNEGFRWVFSVDLNYWWQGMEERGLAGFLTIGIVIVLAAILIGGFFLGVFRVLAYCMMAGFLVLVLLGRQTPSLATISVMVLYILATKTVGHSRHHYKVALQCGAILVLVGSIFLAVSYYVGIPTLEAAFGDVKELRARIQDTSLLDVMEEVVPEELQSPDMDGVYSGGSLESMPDGPQFTGDVAIHVELEEQPTDYVYWGRFIGNTYRGSYWEESGDPYLPENCLDYPSDSLSRLVAFCQEHPQDNIESANQFILDTLASQTTYNLKVGEFPSDVDCAEYFFFDRKEGYCIHYATTAALMFRIYGIPAHYVTGYLIPADMFYLTEEGTYAADVPDSQAHAWIEIYQEGVGWVTIETTPPRVIEDNGGSSSQDLSALGENGGGSAVSAEGQSSEVQPSDPQTAVATAETETEQQSEFSGEPSIAAPSLLWIFPILLLCIVGMAVGLVLRREYLREKRKKKNSKELFQDLYEVMTVQGLDREADTSDMSFVEAVMKAFPWLNREEMTQVMRLVLDLSYGPKEETKEDTTRVRNFYKAFCQHIGEGLGGISRFTFYFVDAWI